jgi:large subunit ribosomal protein L15
MELNNLKPKKGSRHAKKRVGRGPGSGHGKTAGRGEKGQKSRSGYSSKLGFEGGQMPLHRRLPKRGFNKPNRRELNEVNLGRIQEAIEAGRLDQGAPITVESLLAAGVISKPRDGVKILGNGELSAKVTFEVAGASRSAVEAIEKAGGSVTILGAAAQA